MRLAGRDRVVHGGHRRARHGGRRAASSARLMPSCGRASGGIWQWPVAKCRGIGSDAERSLSKDRPRPIPIGIGCASADSCLLERRHLDLAAIGAADSWSSATPSSSSPAVGSRATEHRAGMGLHPQRGDQLAALFAIERRNSELAKQADPGCLAEVYRKIVEMDGSSQRRRPVSGLDEVLTIEAIKIALFAIAALFSRLARSGASSLRPVGSS